jgi:hypothetical protein
MGAGVTTATVAFLEAQRQINAPIFLPHGGDRAAFSTLKAGEAFVNLVASSEYEHRWWGRAIFRVNSVDTQHRLLCERGLQPPFPIDAPWSERFFTSLIRTSTSSALQSCWLDKHHIRIGRFY